ncbi:MAG: DUF6438 domain-containing protein [Planctomycetota bacterium]|nr:DUF6438 domain-containing protein [Planctomycetota bacterium]
MSRFPWPLLALAVLAGCDESPAPSGTEPVQSSSIAPTHAGPTFPGLAETKGGPAPEIADVEITLDRTYCYGWCPVYTVVVRGDGAVVYEGRAHVQSTARAETKIDPALLEPLLREMEAIDLLRHEHTCRSRIWDSPGTTITLRVGATSRTVCDQFFGNECGSDSLGVDPTWHAGIDRIGKLVDELVHVEQWIGTLEQRRPAGDEGN